MKKKKTTYSPVVKTHVRWKNVPPFSWTDVRFSSPKDIDSFIDALRFLTKSKGEEPDHIHLQDKQLKPGSTVESEIVFYRPKRKKIKRVMENNGGSRASKGR